MIRRGGDRRFANEMMSSNRGKKVWTEEEDETLKQLVSIHGTGNWTIIAQSLSDRTGKQCRERFHNHLDKGIKKGDWSEEEDRIIITLQRVIGNQWAKITKLLPGRTDNAVKNRFHATERAKIRGKLDEKQLNNPEFTKYIVQEAMRVNNEVYDLSALQDGQDYQDDEMELEVDVEEETTSFPSAAVCVTPAFAIAALSPDGTGSWITAQPVFSDDEADEEDEEDGDEAMDEVDELMALDIISLDEDDDCFCQDALVPEADPGCFNRDWRSAAPATHAAGLHNKPSFNLCGLEAWNRNW